MYMLFPYSFKVRSFEFLVSSIYLTLIRKGKNRIPIMNCLENADIIVDISGDTFSSEYGIVSILSLGARIFSAKVLKKPVVLYCQSIGPFEGFVDRSLAVLFLKLADLTIAREYVTAKYLRSLGIKTPVCADQAFLLEPTWNKAPLNLPSNKFVIGINLSQYIDAIYGGDQQDNQYRLIMSQLIDLLVERYNAQILIIPEVKKQKENSYDDYYVSKQVFKDLKHKRDVTIIDGDHPPSELKAIAGYCDILISPRFHMVIFAVAQYIPSIAIAYIPKSYGIMKMLGQSEYVINYKDLDLNRLLSIVDKLIVNKSKIRGELMIKMDEIRKSAYYASELVEHLLLEKSGRSET